MKNISKQLAGILLPTVIVFLIMHFYKAHVVEKEFERRHSQAAPEIDMQFTESMNIIHLGQYVRARENYAYSTVVDNYNAVRLMSGPQLFAAFVKSHGPEDINSPVSRLGKMGAARVKIQSITFPEPKSARVQFTRTEKIDFSQGAATENSASYTADIQFEYIQMNLTNEERLINPLGFRVTGYIVSQP